MDRRELHWGKPGPCPSCGVLTDHTWFTNLRSTIFDRAFDREVEHFIKGNQGQLYASKCASTSCESLAVWIRSWEGSPPEYVERLVYPRTRARRPPAEGLSEHEIELYREAADVEPASRRAACALLRVLLEAFLKRHLTEAGHKVEGEPLVKLIGLAVEHLGLSPTLKDGLTAIRKRGNAAVHDPYGLTDDARAEDLPFLFLAVNQLVHDLHLTPQIWAGMAGNDPDERVEAE